MSKLISLFSILCLLFINGMWNFIVGWGMEPKSWGVIIGSFFITFGLTILSQIVSSEKN